MKPNIRPLTGHGLKQALPTSLRTLVVLFAMLLSTAGAWADEVDVSTLTGNYEAPNGTTLTGTLSERYKITIAAGATVTLKDLGSHGDRHLGHAGMNYETIRNIAKKLP